MSMPFVSRDLFTASPSRFTLYYFDGFPPQNPKVFSLPFTCRHLQNYSNFHVSKRNLHFLNSLNYVSLKTHHFRLRVSESEAVVHRDGVANSSFNLESLLSMVESLCIFSSAVVSIGFAINSAVPSSKRTVRSVMGNGVFACGVVALVFGVWIGMWIRRRQWRRICRETVKGGMEINLLERIEKLEEDLKSSATIVRVLSRQLEKLGIRFRVTRKSLKEPIAETAALAQKNSEATRALAAQEYILEKELGEIQKVLLAMQEQQQKQLELILAIGKSAKLWETRQEIVQEQDATNIRNSLKEDLEVKEAQQI